MKIFSIKTRLLALVFLIIFLFFSYFFYSYQKVEWTDNGTLTAHVSPISAKLSGYIQSIYVDDNQFVEKGTLLFSIDQTDYRTAYEQAQANLLAVQANFEAAQRSYEITAITAPSERVSAQEKINAAHAQLEKTRKDLERIQELSNVATKQQLDSIIAQYIQDESAYKSAIAAYDRANTVEYVLALNQANLKQLKAEVQNAKAKLNQALINLENTNIRAPFHGYVTKKSVEIGAFVQAGQQLMAIVSNEPWVVANFKETQLTSIKAGQKALITIDAYPGHKFQCVVNSIQRGAGAAFSLFPPENATGNFVKVVQRIPVKICFVEPLPKELVFGPGMSVLTTVYTDDR
jgi:membrane fusion protein (multidrug efflux system)